MHRHIPSPLHAVLPLFGRLLLAASIAVTCPRAPGQTSDYGSPKHEVRAVWLTTAAGLDWPRSTSASEQKASLLAIVRTLNAANFNTIFFQARARGDAYYRSRYEPWAENLTGTLGKDPGWDPLAFLLEEAHRLGMEVHAWFNVYKIRGPGSVGQSSPPHPSLAHRGWVVEYEREGWFDPGIPAARSYLLDVGLDLVSTYDVDGINFDFIRYPGRDFPDGESYNAWGDGIAREDWRRANINAFVAEFYERATSMKPWLKVGSSPLGVYDPDPASGAGGSFAAYYQDSQRWLRDGVHDYLSPQVYWNIGASQGDPDFAELTKKWTAASAGRHMYIGIAAYKPDVYREITEQIDRCRKVGAQGESFFRYEHIRAGSATAARYALPALIPSMPWKDSTAPPPPSDVTAREIATNVFSVSWDRPSNVTPADSICSYVVYRATTPSVPVHDPKTIAAILPPATRSFADSIRVPEGVTYYYAVTARDRGNNESVLSTPASGVIEELLAIRRKVSEFTSLSASLDPATARPILIGYSLARQTPVQLQILRRRPQEVDTEVALLVNRVQEGGTYVVGVSEITLPRGEYLVRLRTGTTVLDQPVAIPR